MCTAHLSYSIQLIIPKKLKGNLTILFTVKLIFPSSKDG